MTIEQMIEKLRSAVLDDFSRDIVDGISWVTSKYDGPLRLNFFSVAARILFEHSMEVLAPENAVVRVGWFVSQRDNGQPTRAQRVAFAIQGGLTDAFVLKELSVETAPLHRRLLDAVDKLSKHVHGRQNTVVVERAKQDQLIKEVLLSIFGFFEAIAACRSAILEPIAERLSEEAVDTLTSDSLTEVDELASHFGLEEVYVNDLIVKNLGVDTLTYRATGTVAVTLQWGSNSDVRRGDGAELETSFPFFCDFEVPLDNLWELSNAEVSCGVDTEEWWQARAPDE